VQGIQVLLATASDPPSGLIATLVSSFLLLLGAICIFAGLKGSLDEM